MHEAVSKNLATPSKGRVLALRFISGKYQGGEFPIQTDREIIVGRSSDLDMVLVEDMVSRKHARIAYDQDDLVIEDLGSTNGTFVNGEKIKRARLKEGDRLLIGTSILKVFSPEGGAQAKPARPNLESVAAQRKVSSSRTMSGSIEEVPLPDLLQLFATSKKTGMLVVRSPTEAGRIYLAKGAIRWASIDGDASVQPTKCIFRMLAWATGHFDLEPPDDAPLPGALDLSVQEVLMESFRQIDELEQVRGLLPSPTARLVLALPLAAPLNALTPAELDFLQGALNAGQLELALRASLASDLDTARAIKSLIDRQYLRAE